MQGAHLSWSIEHFTCPNTGAGPNAAGGKLWTDKYLPGSSEQLVVHKKKVQEVRDWMTRYLEFPASMSATLLVTGVWKVTGTA